MDINFEQLAIRIENNNPAWAALALNGALVGVHVRDTSFFAATGIRSADPTGGQTGLTDVRIDDNAFDCEIRAIQLSGVTIHQFVSQIRGNRITGCSEAGIILTGATVPGYGVAVHSNAMTVGGHGIVGSLDGLRVVENEVLQAPDAAASDQAGIRLMPGIGAADSLDNVHILANHIAGFPGHGINVRAPRARMLLIKQNRIERCGNGVVFEDAQLLDALAIENNQLSGIEGFGIRAGGAIATLTTANNQINTRAPNPAVSLVFARGESIFDQNHVVRQASGVNNGDVALAAGTLIVGSNRVQASSISMELQVAEQHFTVLGNICRGRIMVNGGPLPQPWMPLNLQGVT
jgi:hypothetical protein